MPERVVLAYSGGLDTSVAVQVDRARSGAPRSSRSRSTSASRPTTTGRRSGDRALAAGAVEAIVVDARDEFARDFVTPGAAGQRALRGQVPARLGAVAPGHRAPPGRARPASTAPTPSPTAARQGQRPGALRGVGARARARPRGARAGARVGLHPRGLDRLRGQARHPDQRDARRARTRSTRTSGAGRSSAASSRTRGSRRPRTCTR